MLCSKLKLFSTLLGTAILFSGICTYADTIALESDGISIEAEDYVSIREDDDFTYLYTMEDDSIPYVIVGSYPECTVPIADDFTEQMMEPNYKDLQVVAGPEEQVIGENTFEKITYSYTIQDQYEVTDERLFIQYGDKVLMFGSKEVPDAGYKNPDNFLCQVAESFKPLAGGGDDYNLILHNGSDDTIKETGSDVDGLSQPDLRGLEAYTESDNGDGSYTYYFEQCGLAVTMPEEFYQGTRVIADIASVTWIHRDSYEAYLKEGLAQGGRLFTIGYSVQNDFMDLPGYSYLGFDENETANWYFSVPTDYQAYIGDDGIQDEFNTLSHMTDEIRENIKIAGITDEIATPGANTSSTESESVALKASPITFEKMTLGKTVTPSDFSVIPQLYNCSNYFSLANPLHLSLKAVSPDSKTVFAYESASDYVCYDKVSIGGQIINPHINGQFDQTTKTTMWNTLTPGEYCYLIAQQTLPGIVLTPAGQDDYETLQALFSDLEKQTFQAANDTFGSGDGMSVTDVSISAGKRSYTYENEGEIFYISVSSLIEAIQLTQEIEMPYVGTTTEVLTSWMPTATYIMICPANEFERYNSAFEVFAENTSVNDQFASANQRISSELSDTIRNSTDLSSIASASADILAAEVGTGDDYNEDRFTDYIFDQNDYTLSNGDHVKISTSYDYVYEGADGQLYVTTNSLDQPADSVQLTPAQ